MAAEDDREEGGLGGKESWGVGAVWNEFGDESSLEQSTGGGKCAAEVDMMGNSEWEGCGRLSLRYAKRVVERGMIKMAKKKWPTKRGRV